MVDSRARGLPSLRESRETRNRAVVQGRVRMRDSQPQFWLWTMVLILAFGVVYWWYAENELEKQKSAVMARQRAFSEELTPRLEPLRDKLEEWVVELASGRWPGDAFHDDASVKALSKSKGLYLRLTLSDATDPESIRKAADRSLHDGFTSCLFTRKARLPNEGTKRCENPSDCPEGQLCNEFDVCAPPSQPYNVRLMYRAMRILSSKWTDELHQTTNDYEVRVFDRDLDKVSKTDVPMALELTSKARYFTALLDEMPEGGLPELPGVGDEGGTEDDVEETVEMRLQAEPHAVRLGIWDLETGQQLVRMRTIADARFIPLGKSASSSLRTQRAQQRQVNNCSIAQTLRRKLSPPSPPEPLEAPAENGEEPPTPEPSSGAAAIATSAAAPVGSQVPSPQSSAP